MEGPRKAPSSDVFFELHIQIPQGPHALHVTRDFQIGKNLLSTRSSCLNVLLVRCNSAVRVKQEFLMLHKRHQMLRRGKSGLV
jgi:hypothetical protein